MKISVGLLAYNSERWIAESAGCLQPFVDEVFVVVDSATTDHTREILDEMGIKHKDRVWNHNYADAKNEILWELSGNWVVILDDDEMYSAEGAKGLVESIKRFGDTQEYDGFEIPMKQHFPYWTTDEENYMINFGFNPHLSVFRSGFKFQNAVHESVNVSPDKRLNPQYFIDRGIFIHHHAWKGNRGKYEALKHNYYIALSEGRQVEHI